MTDLCEDCEAPDGTQAEDGTFRCARCQTRHDENENERAYERSLSDYYGGSGPATVQERYDAEARRRG